MCSRVMRGLLTAKLPRLRSRGGPAPRRGPGVTPRAPGHAGQLRGTKAWGPCRLGQCKACGWARASMGSFAPSLCAPGVPFVLQPERSRGSPRRQARFGSALLLLCVAQHRSWKPQPRLLLGAVLGASYRAHPGGWGCVELSVALTPTPQARGCQGSGSCGTWVPVSLHAPGTLLPLLSPQPRCCGHPEEAGWVFLG